ncbi:MAG: hypothetical protein DWG83_00185 [Chloroflexi bacterium]|nr:hypothetical protein [Chloroflexota bacterium]MDA1241101.1 hypothetical protein [Chloroflexota bacterium]MQC18977.1 hypothetical protein [Chloroflexota bacterium]
MKRTLTGRVMATITGAGFALLPALAIADDGPAFEAAGRAIETSGDVSMVVWGTVFAVIGLFVVTVLGYGYRQKREMRWGFQEPDAPHDDHH